MPKATRMLTRSLFTLAFMLLIAGSNVVLAQTAMTGDWKASVKGEDTSKIELSLERRTKKGSTNQMTMSCDYSELQGLSREQAMRGGAVKFSFARETGTLEFEGSFQNGSGSGTYRFKGNPSFVSAMRSRGFDFEQESTTAADEGREPENRLFTAMALNVTTALADDLLAAGFEKVEVDDLFKAAIFNIDSKFIREMRASGFSNLGMEDFVKARIFKVDADFVRQMARMGFEKESFDNLVKMRMFKVTPQFISEVRNEGLSDVSIEDLVKLRIFKIDVAFIRQAKADGTSLDVEDLVQKRIGVNFNFK